jgi:hypothetical protein
MLALMCLRNMSNTVIVAALNSAKLYGCDGSHAVAEPSLLI